MSTRFLSVRNLLACVAISIAGPTVGAPAPGGATLEAIPARSHAVTSPFAGDANAVKAGKKLYARYCAECHGADGQGDRAPALQSERVQRATPGDLFFVLTNGDLPSGMPSWSRLPDERRWQIAAFLRQLNLQGAIPSSNRFARRQSR